MEHAILMAALIFCGRVADVSLGTLRMLYTIRERKYIAGAIGVIEVSIFMWAISAVIGNIGNLANFLAYSFGFGAGTVLGITIEEFIAPGNLRVTVISQKKYAQIADKLHEMGFGATESFGKGLNGCVDIITTIIRRRDFPLMLHSIQAIDECAFVASDYTHRIYRGYIHRIKRK
jgi:uncharacterized protein YebE (UPF0316 family)